MMMMAVLSQPYLLLSIILSSVIITEAWSPQLSHHRTAIKNNARRSRPINHSIRVEIAANVDADAVPNHFTTRTTTTTTELNLIKYKDAEPAPPMIELTAEEDQALRNSIPAMEEAYGIGWFEESEPLDELKTQYPSLQSYSNEELRRVFIAQKPTVVELFTKTPLGPFLVLNGVAWLGGFSWCDTPFHGADACLP